MRKGRMAAVVSVAATFALAACAPRSMPASSPHQTVPRAAPEFRRAALDGATVDTKALRGQVVVLELFAKSCEHCPESLRASQALHEERADVAFVGISEDPSPTEARELAAAHGVTFPVVHDEGNVLSGRLHTSDMPAVFVVDRTGTVVWAGVGKDDVLGGLRRAVEATR